MKNCSVLLLIALIATSLVDSCTPLDKNNKVRYEVVKLDTARGYAYPAEFNRARDLRKAEMFTEAAYIYILLYTDWHDSVINESIAMAEEIKAIDSTQPVAYYFQQAIGKEMMLDPEVFKRGQEINQKEMKKRYQWSSDLMNELATKGIR
jgi:hypothetical protein